MKKTLVVFLLVVLVAILLTAAVPAPTRLSGILRYSRATICMVPDYVSLPVMQNVFLRGVGFPTQGQYQGCRIDAMGFYEPSFGNAGGCRVFNVVKATIACLWTSTGTAPATSNDVP